MENIRKISRREFELLESEAAYSRSTGSMCEAGGFVLMCGDQFGCFRAVGWCEKNGVYPASNPSAWCPATYALSEVGAVFVAHGGDDVSGAYAWTPVVVGK